MHNEHIKSCIGCVNCSVGRWSGWSCKKGVPGDDDDYSCWEEDSDLMFWNRFADEKYSAYTKQLKLL